MTTSRIFDTNLNSPHYLYSIGNRFLKTGVQLTDELMNKIKPGVEDIVYLIDVPVPAVNISFALEVALKGHILLATNKAQRGHELHKLFMKIPKKNKELILKNMLPVNYEGFKAIGAYADESLVPDKFDVVTYCSDLTYVENSLKVHDSSFVNFRYLHELGHEKSKHILYYDYLFMANFTHTCLYVLFELIKQGGHAFKYDHTTIKD